MIENIDFIYDRLFLTKEKKQNISVFISGAEQTGSSWCSLSLAHALNLSKKSVLLVDGNWELANIPSYINIQPPFYIEDYLDGKKTLNQIITAFKNKDLNILAAKSGNKYLTDIPIGRIQLYAQDLQILSENYDFTFIDLGTSVASENLCLLQIASEVIILCSENTSDLIKTLDLIKYINSLEVQINCKLIINKVNYFEDGYKIYEKLNKASERNGLNFPELIGIIRHDTRIRDTIRNKDMLLTRYPTSEAAQDISEIAKKII